MAVALLAVSGASIAWPAFTNKPMPQALSAVRDMVIRTPLGNQLENVLGVSTQVSHPVNMQDIAASAASDIVSGVEQKTTEVVVGQLMLQLQRQIEKLPPEEQIKIKEMMCKPTSP
jgi:hypothetical protein